jgi:integrase
VRRRKVHVTTWKGPHGDAIPVIVYRDPSGKRCVRKFADARDAYKEAENIEAQLASGVMADANMTVKDYVDGFLASISARVKSKRASKSHRHNCEYILGKLVAKDGGRKFMHLNRMVIKRFLDGLLVDGYAHTTVMMALAVIQTMFSEAVDDQLVTHNPCDGLARRMNFSPEPRRAMTVEEAGKFLKYVREKEPKFALAFTLYLKTGMRLGEGLALRREDFDYQGLKLSVRGNATAFGDITDPKTDLSKRDVEIPPDLADMIRESLGSRVSGWILAPEFPAVPSPAQIRTARGKIGKAMKRITEATKLDGFSTHSLRHTFATLHLNAGANMLWVSRQLGHASIQTTINRYGRGSSPKAPENAARLSDDLNASASRAKYRVAHIFP